MKFVPGVALFLVTGAVAIAAERPPQKIILTEEHSDFGSVWVFEEYNQRCMSFDKSTSPVLQTCFYLNSPNKIVFDYQKSFLSALFLNPNPKSVLIIGLGGGTTAMTLSNLVPETKIEAVELNPAVAKVAKEHFNFKESDRMKLFIEDGLKFVADAAKSGRKYDLIFVDAFSKDYIPVQFLSDEFVLNLKQIMSEKCVVAVNTWPGSSYEQQENDLYQKHFGWFYNLVGENRIIMVGQKLTQEQFRDVAKSWEKQFHEVGIDSANLVSEFNSIYPKTPK